MVFASAVKVHAQPFDGFSVTLSLSPTANNIPSSKPQVLLAQLGDEQHSLFEDLYSNLLENIRIDYEIIKADSAAALVQHVSNPCPQLKAALIVQGDLSQKKLKKVQVKLSQYVKAGGAIIMCCLFSNFVSTPNFVALMQNMDLEWGWGDYHRTDFALNPAFESVFGVQAFATLKRSYSMVTLLR